MPCSMVFYNVNNHSISEGGGWPHFGLELFLQLPCSFILNWILFSRMNYMDLYGVLWRYKTKASVRILSFAIMQRAPLHILWSRYVAIFCTQSFAFKHILETKRLQGKVEKKWKLFYGNFISCHYAKSSTADFMK